MKHSTRQKRWLGAAVLFNIFWFPPSGILAAYHMLRQKLARNNSNITIGRSLVKVRSIVRYGFLGGQILFVFLCAYVFSRGGELISSLDSFF